MKTKDKLKDLGVRPSRQRGQNFLIDDSVVNEIINFGRPRKGETLVEIGPGLGALTKALHPYGNLTVVEIEEKFAKEIEEKYPDINVINEDVRFVDFLELGEKLTVFGNLPYSFSTEILFFLIDTCPNVDRAILLLQKEFVDRLAASPGSRDFSVLSISVQLKANVYQGPVIPGNCFHPPTKVDSCLVELRMLDKPRVEVEDPLLFKRVVQAAFLKRRKKVFNSLCSSKIAHPEEVEKALADAGINPDLRAEDLDLKAYARLSNSFSSIKL